MNLLKFCPAVLIMSHLLFTSPTRAAPPGGPPVPGASVKPMEEGVTLRFSQGVTAYVDNPQGQAFEAAVDVRDWNQLENGPREMLLKVYDPEGVTLARKVVEDDGVTGHAYMPEAGGWDHEMWYYLLNYGRGSVPMIRWSSLSEPSRLAALAKRTFTFPVPAGKKGIYRVMMVGSRDHVATLRIKPGLKYALAGHPLWLHGHGDLFKRSYVYVPKGTLGIELGFAEFDQPVTRHFTVTGPDGVVLWDGAASGGYQKATVKLEPAGKYDDKLLTVDVADGQGDYMLRLTLNRHDGLPYRLSGGAPALFAPDKETAMALKGGAIYHDDLVFWHGFQVRFHDWLKSHLKPEDYVIKDAAGKEIQPVEAGVYGRGTKSFAYRGLPEAPGFVPLNGMHEPPPLSDSLMHNYVAHKDPAVLHVALRDLAGGFRTITVGDSPIVSHGNMGYVFGTYGWHFWRPAWRVVQQSDAPQEVKDIVREGIILCGDRLAFARGIERSNGNALSHIPIALRYAAEGAKDPVLTGLADTYLERFANGGWGDRVGISKSGDCQEHFAHDYHYGSYILSNLRAVVNDFQDPRFKAIRERIVNLYNYMACEQATAFPWNARTHQTAPLELTDWKAKPGPDFTVSVNDGNEWFAARRKNYYVLTFHGKLTPEWLNYYWNSRLGYGGGILCQLTIPGKGTVLASTLAESYGKGMERGNWPNFHIHSLVGTLANGQPFVAGDSEHLNARLEGNTVTGSGEVRDCPVHVTRSYTFEEDRIRCSVKLADTDYRTALLGMGVPSTLAEVYEMIPFISGSAEHKTVVKAFAADGKEIGDLTEQAVEAASLTIDRGGFGVRIQLERPHSVKRGKADTVLIEVAKGNVKPEQVALSYLLTPYPGNAK